MSGAPRRTRPVRSTRGAKPRRAASTTGDARRGRPPPLSPAGPTLSDGEHQRRVIECLDEHLVCDSQLDGANAEEALALIEQQGSAAHQADDWATVCEMVEELVNGFWRAESLFASLEEVDQLGPGRTRIT